MATKATEAFEPLDFDKELEKLKNRKWYHEAWWWVRRGIWQWLENRPRAIRWFIQRGRRGWADVDAWNFCYYLPTVIAESTAYLKTISHGYPALLDSDDPIPSHIVDAGHPDETDQWESTHERWKAMLDDIAFTFWAAHKIGDDEWYSPDAGWGRSKEWTTEWYSEWDARAKADREKFSSPYHAMTKEEVERYNRGWKYFKDFFFSLWD